MKENKTQYLIDKIHIKGNNIAVISKPRSGNNTTILITLIIMSGVNPMCKVGETDIRQHFN